MRTAFAVSFATFVAGLAVGMLVMLHLEREVNSPTALTSAEKIKKPVSMIGISFLPPNSQAKSKLQADRTGRSNAGSSSLHETLIRFQPGGDELLAAMQSLSREEAAFVAHWLNEFEDKLRAHEMAAAKITKENPSQTVIEIPRLESSDKEAMMFQMKLEALLGEERAKDFSRATDRVFVRQFANWGREQVLIVETNRNPPTVRRSYTTDNNQGGVTLQNAFHEWAGEYDRYAHLIRFEE